MDCPNCQSPNEKDSRYCRQCGSALGTFCKRCDHVGAMDDKYCPSCGNKVGPDSQEHLFTDPAEFGGPKQYSRQEIEELLALRRKIRLEEERAVRVTQEGVDFLFKELERQ